MSVCVGQSLRQPLQARHISSASFTSSLCQPSVITSPRSISFSSRAAAARRVALLPRRAVARAHGAALGRAALAHADAALGGAREAVALVAEEGHARRERHRLVVGPLRAGARPRGRPRPARRPACPGFIRPSGSQMRLNSRNAAISSGPYMSGRNSARALAVAVLARQRAAVGDHQLRGLAQEIAPVREALGACAARS